MKVNWLHDRTRLMGDKVAVIDPHKDTEYTYNELYERAQKVAVYLQSKGIGHGDRVALYSPNDVSYFDLLFASTLIGAIFVPLNWRLSAKEIIHVVEDANPSLIIYSNMREKGLSSIPKELLDLNVDESEYEEMILQQDINKLQPVKVNKQDIALLVYTSGTTGMPKGAMISHLHLISNALFTIPSWQVNQFDRTIAFSPMFHVAGLNAFVLPILMVGGQVIIDRVYQPQKALDYIKEYKPTVLFMVPTMYYDVVKLDDFKKETFESVRFFVSGGASMSNAVYEAFESLGLPLIDSYGLTEAGSNNFFMDPAIASKHRGSVGKPIMFLEMYVADDEGNPLPNGEIGELLIAGETTFSGYWNQPEKTAETFHNEYVQTGDLVRVDDEGYYYIVGRKKDMIITGGENVYPTEVENAINLHEAIDDSVAFGFPHEKWGESVAAAIILNHDLPNLEKELDEFMHIQLAGYKTPKKYLVVDEFPKTSVGKIDKSKLVDMLLEKLDN